MPAIADIVHFITSQGRHVPALVTSASGARVDLVAFDKPWKATTSGVSFHYNVHQFAQGMKETWHYPEALEEAHFGGSQ